MISVGIVGPIGPGPLSHSPSQLSTQYSENKPPRNLQAKLVENSKFEITWEHNCPWIGQYPEMYVLNVTELTYKHSTSLDLKMKATQKLSHIYAGVQWGAVYNISVGSKGANAKPAVVTIHGPPLPSPRQLKAYREDNGTYTVAWHEIDDKNKT